MEVDESIFQEDVLKLLESLDKIPILSLAGQNVTLTKVVFKIHFKPF